MPSFDSSTSGGPDLRGLELRAAVLASVRRFFCERGFLEVETPVMVRCPGLDLHLDGFEVAGGLLGAPAFLQTSPEYHMKRLLCAGLPRIFQLAHCFRRGELGAWHNPEFTMLEWYRANAGMQDVMADTEALVRELVTELRSTASPIVGGRAVQLAAPFERLTVRQAFARWVPELDADPVALASDDEDRFFRLWVERVDPGLAALPAPTFVTEFPAPFASLARLVPGRPDVCERFELYVGGLELCNGFGELTDPVEQRQRFERDRAARAARGKPVYPIDARFLAALERGLPPSGGNALGIDRLVALCAGVDDLDCVVAFPASRL